MPGIHSAMSRHLFTLDGKVLTSGGGKHLAKGQFTIVKSQKPTAQGAEVVSDFAGLPKDEVLEMRLGKHKGPNTRTGDNGKSYASENFNVNSLVSVKANFPKSIEQKFDELIIGYDGVNASTAISLDEGQTTVLDITLFGPRIQFITGQDQFVFKKHFGREEGETNQEMINRLVENLKKDSLPQGVPLTDLIKISTVDSSKGALGGTEYVFSTLTLTDSGDSNALARVQSQYNEFDVKLTERSGLASTYTILHPASETLGAFEQTIPSYIKDCEDCIAGYTEIASGIVYSVSIEDDGADLTTTVDDLPGFVAGSVVKIGNDDGAGIYSVVVATELTSAQIATYVGTAGPKSTARIKFIGDVKAVCNNSTVTSTAWVDGESCFASTEAYTIQLKDDECDGSTLAKLQAAYPELTIVEASSQEGATSTAVTITGTSGTANVSVGGTDYLATFATSPTVTATNFVTAHAAALAAEGVVVTSAAAVLTFVDEDVNAPTVGIENVSGNLAGTVAEGVPVTGDVAGGCQTVYSTTVVTDIVCDECDNIFLDSFKSEAPSSFNFTEWEKVEDESDVEALMGIRLVGKPFNFTPTEATRDQVPFYETSVRIEAAGGYIEEVTNSFDPQYSKNFNVKRLSRAQDRDNLGAHLLGWEEASMYYFDGQTRHKNNLFAKGVFGEESVLKYTAQYCSYEITVHDGRPSQGVGRHSDMSTTYIVWAEVGRHTALEAYVNSLAAAAGLSAVQTVAK